MITRLEKISRACFVMALMLLLSAAGRPAFSSDFLQLKVDSTPDPPLGKMSIFDHFQQESPLEITIETNLDELINNRRRTEYQGGRILIRSAAGASEERYIEIRPRGKYRRRVCDFPPVKISFKKANLQAEGLDPAFDDIKLVTHCLDDREAGNANVLREFLVYKLYALLTDKAYRVQLAEITYLDTSGKYGKTTRYAFLIEDTGQLAQRLRGRECDGCMNPDLATIPENELALLSVFQFMIGNADWNIPMVRNLKLVMSEDKQHGVLVPYDFDFSGLVNASYAVPNVDYQLSSTRQRIFLGPPVSDEALRWGIKYLESKKNEMLAYVDGFDPLPRRHREDVKAYLEFFFDYLKRLDSAGVKGLYRKIKEVKVDYPSKPEVGSGKSEP